jgi:hypothetical protein
MAGGDGDKPPGDSRKGSREPSHRHCSKKSKKDDKKDKERDSMEHKSKHHKHHKHSHRRDDDDEPRRKYHFFLLTCEFRFVSAVRSPFGVNSGSCPLCDIPPV